MNDVTNDVMNNAHTSVSFNETPEHALTPIAIQIARIDKRIEQLDIQQRKFDMEFLVIYILIFMFMIIVLLYDNL